RSMAPFAPLSKRLHRWTRVRARRHNCVSGRTEWSTSTRHDQSRAMNTRAITSRESGPICSADPELASTLRYLHEQHAQVEEHVLEEARFLGGEVPARLLLQHRQQVDALLRHGELGLVALLPRRRVGRLAHVHEGARAEREHERVEVESRSLLLV